MRNKTAWYMIGIIIGFILLMGVSWLATCGIVKLITMCFDWTFAWDKATGVWLTLILLTGVFNISVKK